MDLQAETAPIGMRNMAKKRAPMFVVPVAIAFPTAATSIKQTMWIDLSLVLDDVQVTKMETRNVANLGGFVSKKDMPPCFKTESAYPDWSRQPKRVDASISQRSDDGREEVLEGLAEEADVLQKHEQVQPVVCQGHLEPGHGGLCMSLILLVDVGQKAPSCKVFLLVGQPGCCGWVIRKKEAREDSYADRDYTLLRTGTPVSSRSGLA